jgi:hypothetical protein
MELAMRVVFWALAGHFAALVPYVITKEGRSVVIYTGRLRLAMTVYYLALLAASAYAAVHL